MIESRTADPISASGINPMAWMSPCFQPWAVFEEWNKFWTQQWTQWFDAVASMPAPWLPMQPENGCGEPFGLDLFFPWLPRIEAFVTPLERDGDRDAMRVRLRAAMANTMTGERAEWLNVDATVSRLGAPAPLAAEEGPRRELAAATEQVIDTSAAQAAGSRDAPKPRPRRSRAGTTPGTDKPGSGG